MIFSILLRIKEPGPNLSTGVQWGHFTDLMPGINLTIGGSSAFKSDFGHHIQKFVSI